MKKKQKQLELKNNEIAEIMANINKYTKELDILKQNMKNGTTNGVSCKFYSSAQRKTLLGVGILGGLAGVIGVGMIDDALLFWTGLGILPACITGFAAAAVVGGGMALYNKLQKKNPDSSFSKRYFAELPHLKNFRNRWTQPSALIKYI